jgi:hypothetical protein
MTFLMSCRIELTAEEQALSKYKAENHPITWRQGDGGSQELGLTLSWLLKGHQQELKDIGTLLENETVIKSGCNSFRQLLDVMASFGGERVIEYGPSGSSGEDEE